MIEEYLFLLAQVWLCIRAAYCGMWWKALYWLGAFILTVAIVKGLNR